MPQLADSLLDLGRSLIGTRYRYGGTSVQSGFDCSGFVGYLFREEVGLELPRSTRELIKLDAPKVARADLEPGDLIFWAATYDETLREWGYEAPEKIAELLADRDKVFVEVLLPRARPKSPSS